MSDGLREPSFTEKSSPRTFFANLFAANFWQTRSRPANVRQIFESCRRRRHFWRTVRQFAANSAWICTNSGEVAWSSPNVRGVRRTFARVREEKKLANAGGVRANSRELARVCGERSFAMDSAKITPVVAVYVGVKSMSRKCRLIGLVTLSKIDTFMLVLADARETRGISIYSR